MTWRTIYIIVMLFIAFAFGPITYVDYAKKVHEYDQIEACREDEIRQHGKGTQPPWVKFMCGENSGGRPDISTWINNWWAGAALFMFLAAIPFVWSFMLNRLRELSKAIRGID